MTLDFLPRTAILEEIDGQVPDHHLFSFRLPDAFPIAPGQFAELTVPGIGGFAVSTAAFVGDHRFQACIRRIGRVTDALYRLPLGARVGLRGPFGKGFPLEEFLGRDVLLIAGGLGMAPLRALLQALVARRGEIGRLSLLYGAHDPQVILFKEELNALARQGLLDLHYTVDFAAEIPWRIGGIACQVGLLPKLLDDVRLQPRQTVAAVCGPPGLYRCVLDELAGFGLAAETIFASLERRMRCGIGQCCHCAVAGAYVCRDGPVFSLAQLRRMEGAI
ncbi:FAD/NAD(P)-binding protein [Geoalkalibacter sp.]|uniref:FAD/NAD(P)-binding protein n=1 Tax=Geoalkalibacter sp. TaxID=3041440 RepID=UPI00272E3D65|nr:FAD/NAD(P)-binding protein [Geoalkalibacter sp.]